MHPSHHRRAFLRRAAFTAAVLVLAVTGCTLERQRTDEAEQPGPPRPILLPWEGDAMLVAAPPGERPVAYLSRSTMEAWIDLDFRDQLQFVLGAHISVSTGHWRVPLAGDPSNIPIQAGDPLREFEEVDMREWRADLEPTEGDVRVMRGAPLAREVSVACQPVSGGGTWLSAEPLRLLRAGSPSMELTREELMEVGIAARFTDRECTREAGSVRLVTWASREQLLSEGP